MLQLIIQVKRIQHKPGTKPLALVQHSDASIEVPFSPLVCDALVSICLQIPFDQLTPEEEVRFAEKERIRKAAREQEEAALGITLPNGYQYKIKT